MMPTMPLKTLRVGLAFTLSAGILTGWLSSESKAFAEGVQVEAPYCLALRGNGELVPAQWGAISRLIERMGLPQKMAGGSSASITLFLMESIAQSPILKDQSPSVQRLRASLLLKTLPAYLGVVAERPEWHEMAALAMLLKQQGGGENMEFQEWLQKMVETQPEKLAQLIRDNFSKIQNALKIAIDYGVVDPATFQPLLAALTELERAQNSNPPGDVEPILRRVRFYAGENLQSIQLLGKFDAKNDSNLFFRRGIVSFRQLSQALGRVGNFYAGRGMTTSQIAAFEKFAKDCGPDSKDRVWMDLAKKLPACQETFKQLVEGYQSLARRNRNGLQEFTSREKETVGKYIPAFPTTAVLVGQGHETAQAALNSYDQMLDAHFGDQFTVPMDTVRFGYWGPEQDLAKIEDGLKKNYRDEKSALFKSLGEASWETALSLSPAEPGLARLQGFEIGKTKEAVTSAGGWSDLHPVTILKASGCGQVVYVTRVGGESLFGQGVAKRLLGFTEDEIPWGRLDTSNDEVKKQNRIANNNGNPADFTSRWSRLYNLANQESSFTQALTLATAVVCTNWDSFNITDPGSVEAMTRDAFNARYAFTDLASSIGQQALRKGWALATKADNNYDSNKGFRPYAGCLPF